MLFRSGTALGNCLEVGDLVTFSRGPVRAAYRERLRKTGFSGIWENLPLPGVFRRGNIVIFAENEGFRVEYFNPASNVKMEFYFRQPEIGGGVTELRLNGRTVRHNGLRSSILEIYQYEF